MFDRPLFRLQRISQRGIRKTQWYSNITIANLVADFWRFYGEDVIVEPWN